MTTQHTPGRLYADRDIINQGPHYVAHVSAMTKEGLHSKSDIAAELAHRDIVAMELQDRLKAAQEERDEFLTALGDCRDAMPDTTANINEAIAFPTSVPAYVRESVSLLAAQRDELLEALKRIDSMCEKPIRYSSIAVQEAARAAIAEAEGGAA